MTHNPISLVFKNKIPNMKTRFYLHGYINTSGETQIFFSVTINKKRERIATKQFVNPKNWNFNSQRTRNNNNINIILDNIFSKATQIKTFYFLTKRELSIESFKKDFFSETPSYDFNSYMESMMLLKCANPNTLKKHKSILKKLREYQEIISFSDITFNFFTEYRSYLRKLGNNRTTENSNIKIIKHYLIHAKKEGITLQIDLDEIKPGSCSGNRTSISIEDTKKLSSFFFSEYIKDTWRLSLGYFLFAYNTGMRISDLKNIKREELSDYIEFNVVKNKKDHQMKLNNNVKAIIHHENRLFNSFKAQQKINEDLKQIAKFLGIRKKISLHVARHTFATNYLKAGGKVENLQILLGHNKIETTMIYVHLNKDDALETVHLLDSL